MTAIALSLAALPGHPSLWEEQMKADLARMRLVHPLRAGDLLSWRGWLKLVDRIGYLEDAVKLAREAAKVSEARVVMYHRPREYRANFYSMTPAGDGGLAQMARLIGAGGPRFLYLWWP